MRYWLLAALFGMGCAPPAGPMVAAQNDWSFFPFFPASTWLYDDSGESRPPGGESTKWHGKAVLRVMDFDEATRVAKLRMSREVWCTSRTVFARQTAGNTIELLRAQGRPGEKDVVDEWTWAFAPAGGSVTRASTLLGGGGFSALGLVEVTAQPRPSSTPTSAFRDAISLDLPRLSVTWDPTLGPTAESFAGVGGFSLQEYTLDAFDIRRPEGTIRDGLFPSEDLPPAAPKNLIAVRTASTQAKLFWGDCSLNEANFIVERLCGVEADFSRVAMTLSDVDDYEDTGIGAEACSYRAVAVNAAGESTPSMEFAIGSDGTPPTPLAPSLQRGSTSVRSIWVKTELSAPATISGYWLSWQVVGSDRAPWKQLATLIPPGPSTTLFYTSDGTVSTTERPDSIDWPPGQYRFKLKAQSATAESPFGPEGSLTVN